MKIKPGDNKSLGPNPGVAEQARSARTSAAARAQKATSAQEAENSASSRAQGAGLAGPAGTVRLSERVEEVERVRAAAKAEPEVRPDVVERAKAELAAGKLTADPHELASLVARDLF
jgi:flagellar biosynthesis anti-sigma factor FlgM